MKVYEITIKAGILSGTRTVTASNHTEALKKVLAWARAEQLQKPIKLK
ncbi:hypothetical protein [Siphonobacter sp. SORGH_AS_1065]|nr:hypothetical protein [Siphonobacter sp. SORGH_AS_1065]MDQ1088600.1 hypothetical protein [Siphonobacter sp. SORGH_AS_1065]